MNKVILLGRFTTKPELRYTSSNVPVATFTLAVPNDYKSADGERKTDFINCYSFRKTGETISKYFNKGDLILVSGSIRVDIFENKDGQKRQAVRVNVEQFNFVEKKEKNETEQDSQNETSFENDPFAEYGDSIEIDDSFLD